MAFKHNLKNGLEAVKGAWRRHFVTVPAGNTPAEDARLLAAMCAESRTMVASDGYRYWYYFPMVPADGDVIRHLMERNGITPTFRLSKYGMFGSGRRAAFRVSHSYLLNSGGCLDFVKSIPTFGRPEQRTRVLDKINAVRNELGVRTR